MAQIPQRNLLNLRLNSTKNVQNAQTRKIDFMSYNDLYNYAMNGAAKEFQSKYTDVTFKAGCQEALNVAGLHKSDFMTTSKDTILEELHTELLKTAQASAKKTPAKASTITNTKSPTQYNNITLISATPISINGTANKIELPNINANQTFVLRDGIVRPLTPFVQGGKGNDKAEETGKDETENGELTLRDDSTVQDLTIVQGNSGKTTGTDAEVYAKSITKLTHYEGKIHRALYDYYVLTNFTKDDLIKVISEYIEAYNSCITEPYKYTLGINTDERLISDCIDKFFEVFDNDGKFYDTANETYFLGFFKTYRTNLYNMKSVSSDSTKLIKEYDANNFFAEFIDNNPFCGNADDIMSNLVTSVQEEYKSVYSASDCPLDSEAIKKLIKNIITSYADDGKQISVFDIVNNATTAVYSVENAAKEITADDLEDLKNGVDEVLDDYANLSFEAGEYIAKKINNKESIVIDDFIKEIKSKHPELNSDDNDNDIKLMFTVGLMTTLKNAGVEDDKVSIMLKELVANGKTEYPEDSGFKARTKGSVITSPSGIIIPEPQDFDSYKQGLTEVFAEMGKWGDYTQTEIDIAGFHLEGDGVAALHNFLGWDPYTGTAALIGGTLTALDNYSTHKQGIVATAQDIAMATPIGKAGKLGSKVLKNKKVKDLFNKLLNKLPGWWKNGLEGSLDCLKTAWYSEHKKDDVQEPKNKNDEGKDVGSKGGSSPTTSTGLVSPSGTGGGSQAETSSHTIVIESSDRSRPKQTGNIANITAMFAGGGEFNGVYYPDEQVGWFITFKDGSHLQINFN